jgi:hypothetical protein
MYHAQRVLPRKESLPTLCHSPSIPHRSPAAERDLLLQTIDGQSICTPADPSSPIPPVGGPTAEPSRLIEKE